MYQTNEHNTNRNYSHSYYRNYIFIKIGENIGAINTIFLIILTVNWSFCSITRDKTIKSGFINIYQNKIPIYEIFSGFVAIAAIFLIIPGFFTDTIGFILLIPITRKFDCFNNENKKQNSKEKTIEAEIIEEKKMNYKIIAKYIKIFILIFSSWKIFYLYQNISNYKFKIDIKSSRYKDNIIEI